MKLLQGRSLSARLTLLFALSSTLVLLLLGNLILMSVDQHFLEQDTELLQGKMALTRHALQLTNSHTDLQSLPQRLDDSLVGHHDLSVAVVDAAGGVLFASEHLHLPADLLGNSTETTPRAWQNEHGSFRSIVGSTSTGIADLGPVSIVVATEISHHVEFLDAFRISLWVFVIVAAILMGMLGWIVTRRALSPLRDMQRGAAAVTASKLDYRLPVDAVPVEFAELAHSLNQMLARLEESFQRLSDFSSDLAHELRTPISNLLMQTQVGLSRSRNADEYREMLYSNVEELERMTRMVADMLFLAKADNGLMTPAREQIELADEVAGLFEFYQAVADDKSVRLAAEGSAQVSGDRLMLRRALSNLLSNAIRHTDAGGEVSVRIGRGANGNIRLSVENPGPGTPAEHLPRLFDRFYRVDASRHRSGEGYGLGLGLAITRSILRAHGGDITVHSADGLTRFECRLPDTADAAFAN